MAAHARNHRCRKPHYLRAQRGFFQLEIIVGLIILETLMTGLLMIVARQKRAENQLADSRAAVRLAEETLIHYETKPQAGAENDPRVSLHWLADESPIAGHAWLQVTAVVSGRQAKLVGLAPRPAAASKEADHAEK